ncbi:MAG: hypothetical protein KDC84_01315 [Crocinitomicaceae bacterium]|nr:hypothetical protein [Crocinitomicaceae bacterium]
MIQEASVTGLIRTILIIVGVLVVLRLIGRIMMAKREMENENRQRRAEKAFEKERQQKIQNFGKVNISDRPANSSNEDYVDYEEVD